VNQAAIALTLATLVTQALPPAAALEPKWQRTPDQPGADPGSRFWQPVPADQQPGRALRWQATPQPDAASHSGAGEPTGPMPLSWQPVPPGEVIDPAKEIEAAELARAQAEETKLPPPILVGPYIGGALPNAYTASAGDWWAALSAGTPGKLRGGVVDGSASVGIGLGNAFKTVSVGLTWNVGSINYLNANGGFDVAISRVLVTSPAFELAVSGGYMNFAEYGNESGTWFPNLYGVVSASTVLRRRNPFKQLLTVSAGIGGNNFAYLGPDFRGPSTGYFAAVGLELTPQLGASAGLSGRGANLALSYAPFPRSLPVSVNLVAADIFNSSPYGTVGILSIAFGGNLFKQGRYSFW